MSDLQTAFLETTYKILFEDGTSIHLKIGEMPSDLLSKIPKLDSWAFITAWNPLPDILSQAENYQRNSQLRDTLLKMGYAVHPGVGVSKDGNWSEDSFFIENIEKNTANELSATFGQLAFVFGNKITGNQLIFTTPANS